MGGFCGLAKVIVDYAARHTVAGTRRPASAPWLCMYGMFRVTCSLEDNGSRGWEGRSLFWNSKCIHRPLQGII